MKKNIFLHENNSSEMTFYTVEVLFYGIKSLSLYLRKGIFCTAVARSVAASIGQIRLCQYLLRERESQLRE